MDGSMINVVSSGALVNKSPKNTKNMIATIITNAQEFSIHYSPPQKVNEVEVLINIKKKLVSFLQVWNN